MNEVIITLFGSISQYWYDKNYMKYFLDKAKGKPVRLKVTSYGGDVAEAVAISNLIAEHGDVTVEFIGFNASAATWMAFGAKRIEMHADGMWLAHKCSVSVDIYGALNADQLDDKIKELQSSKQSAEAIDLMIAKKYADRSGKSVKDVLSLMKESKWIAADEVKEWGFVDEIIPGINKRAKVTDELSNCFSAMGLPIPVVEDKQQAEPTMVEQILAGIKNLFKQEEKKNINQPLTNMRKEFLSVNQILNVEGLNESDGKITLTVDQVKAINDAIKAAKEGQTNAENTLKGVIDDLDSLSDQVKSAADNKAKVQAIRDILDKIPGTKTSTNKESDEKNKFADIATDPINEYENE